MSSIHTLAYANLSALALVGPVLVVLGCATTLAQEVPNDVFVSTTVEAFYHAKYRHWAQHKAIAVGPAGVAGLSSRNDDKLQAEQVALAYCQKRLRKSPYKTIRRRKCHLYALDDEIVFKGKLPELPLGSALTGEDIPLKKSLHDRSPKTKARGILLMLHGCNRVRSLPKWIKRWFKYFRSKGLHVIAPNSFAERRPPQQCPPVIRGRKRYTPRLRVQPVITRVRRIRSAQTYRTLGVLKERYPDLPILIWGHSEGARIAQFISMKVAGVLTSGTGCGISKIRGIMLVKPVVPVLALIGSKDSAVRAPKKLTRESVARYCNRAFQSPEWNFVYLKGVGHYPSIRNRTVRKAVDEFLERSLELHVSPAVQN